jgi:hypothetical protein
MGLSISEEKSMEPEMTDKFQNEIINLLKREGIIQPNDDVYKLLIKSVNHNKFIIEIVTKDLKYSEKIIESVETIRSLLVILKNHNVIGTQSHIQKIAIELKANEIPKISLEILGLIMEKTIFDNK